MTAPIESAQGIVLVYVQQMATLCEAISELGKKIQDWRASSPNWGIFDSLPGAGNVMARG